MSLRTVVSLVIPLVLSTVAVSAFAEEPVHEHARRTARKAPRSSPSCLEPKVEISDGRADERVALTTCSGTAAPLAVERLSVLARPEHAPRPTRSLASLARVKGPTLSAGVRRMDPGIVERLEQIAMHFSVSDRAPKVVLVSGYRPMSHGSHHQLGKALDFRLEGIPNEEIVAYCKTMDDTGCGFYPNSAFVHIDVRDSGSGHVAWIDSSVPGEHPHYVASWPVSADDSSGTPVVASRGPRGAEAHDDMRNANALLPKLPSQTVETRARTAPPPPPAPPAASEEQHGVPAVNARPSRPFI